MPETVDFDLEKRPLEVREYTSKSATISFWNSLKILVSEFPAAHALGFTFAKRNISTKYRQSIFGLLWAFLPPLATATIWIMLHKTHVINLSDVGAPYPLFVITGTMLWSVFVNAIMTPMQVIQANKSILVKINFPREALIVDAFYEILFTTLINFIIMVVFLFIFKVEFHFSSLLFFPGLFLLIFLGMSIGLLLLPFSLLYRDIQFVLPTVLQLAMYLTPILYATPPFLAGSKIHKLNLVTPILTQTRASILNMSVHVSSWDIGIAASVALSLFVVGVILQRITMQILIERMGS